MRINTAHEIGLLVRDLRIAQGVTQEDLAERIGATRQWVRGLESGKPRLELGLTLRALRALGIGVELQLPPTPEPATDATPRRRARRDRS